MFNCEICRDPFEFLEKHHIHSKALGGSNHKSNITFICPNCHELVHRGKIILEGKYMTTNGEKLIWRNENTESITGNPDPPVFIIKKIKDN